MSFDLSLEKHVSTVSAACFFTPANSSRVRQSLDADSAATLVHAFVTSRVGYCNPILAGSPRFAADKSDEFCRRRRQQHAEVGSSTAAFRGYYMTSSTGSTLQTKYDSSSPC